MLKSFSTWLLALILIAASLLFFESEFLWKTQELNLFLTTPDFFCQQMVVSGGLLTYLGTFLTQFLAIPWLGVLMLCALWFLIMWLTRRAFRVSDRWSVLMLIPVALILITIVDMGYWVYLLKLRGHFFVTTLGVTAVVALLWAFRSLPSRWGLRAIFIVLTCLAGYPLLGIYALAAAVVMGFWTWRLTTKGESIINTLVALVAVRHTVALLSVRVSRDQPYQYLLDRIAALPCDERASRLLYTLLPPFLVLHPDGRLLPPHARCGEVVCH